MQFMIILSISIVLAPVAVTLFFVFYKIWLHFHRKKLKRLSEMGDEVSVAIEAKKPIVNEKDDEYDYCILDDADEEMTAVITAAVKIYLKQSS